MRFEWDESKNRTNYRKHAVWFEEAQTVWADSRSIEFFGAQRRGGSISPNRIFNWRAIAVDRFLRARIWRSHSPDLCPKGDSQGNKNI